MNTELAYCPRCDQQVRLAWTPLSSHDGEANLKDAELVCLEFGECCSGGSCPVSRLPSAVMGVRLARSGIHEGAARTVRALCEGCGQIQEQRVVDGSLTVCTYCETTNANVVLGTRDAWVVALAPAVHGIPLPGATDVPD